MPADIFPGSTLLKPDGSKLLRAPGALAVRQGGTITVSGTLAGAHAGTFDFVSQQGSSVDGFQRAFNFAAPANWAIVQVLATGVFWLQPLNSPLTPDGADPITYAGCHLHGKGTYTYGSDSVTVEVDVL